MTSFEGEDSWSFAGDVPEGEAVPSPDPTDSGGVPLGVRTPQEGDRFGSYLILSKLGAGGMGVVFRARDELGGREVALKILSARRMNARQRDRFKREGELTATLRHSGIVRIHAGGEIDGIPYLAYELVRGGRTLGEQLDRAEPMRCVELLRDVATAVGFAHRHGVVHRDLKPDNVLIDESGHPRVADFGLAWAEGQDRLTRTGALVGTPAFMAPEQFHSEAGTVGPWTDVWALGVMLYQGLTKEPPFKAASLVELAAKVAQSRVQPPRKKNPAVSADLEAICLKALEPEPQHRYANGELFAADLTAVLTEGPVSASSVRWRWRRRGKSARRLMAVVGVLVLVLAVALLWEPGGERRREVEVARLLDDFRLGRSSRDQVEAALAQGAGLRPDVRASLHLALAGGEGKDDAGWQLRARHAEEAIKLAQDPALQGSAFRARGRALVALGLYALADEAYTEASTRSDDPQVLLELGRTRLRAERHDTALLAVEAYLAKRPGVFAGYQMLVRIQAGQGRHDQALRTAKDCLRDNPGPDAHVLVAEAIAASGDDPRPFLRKALQDWPRHDGLTLALAEHLFVARGEARAAASLLAAQKRKRSSRAAHLVRCLSDLGCLDVLGTPPRALRLVEAPVMWRQAAARWLLSEARREQAFIERASDPFVVRSDAALPLEDRRVRVERALQALEQLGPEPEVGGRAQIVWARFKGPQTEAGRAHLAKAQELVPGNPEYLLLRGEALLEAGEAQKALDALQDLEAGPHVSHERLARARARALLEAGRHEEAATQARGAQPWLLDADALDVLARAEDASGRAAEAERAQARAKLLREAPHRGEARKIIRGAPGARSDADLQLEYWTRAADRDPGWLRGRYEVAKAVYKTGERLGGLRGLVWCVSRDPGWLGDIHRDVMVLSHATPSRTSDALPWLIDQLQPMTRSRVDLLILAILSAGTVECGLRNDWLPKARAAAEDAITANVGDPIGYIVRAFVHIRSRRLVEASRDLAIAAEEAPDCSGLVFYQALFAAAEGSISVARRHLARLKTMNYEPIGDNAWSRQWYPEMEPFAKKPGFELFELMQPRRD